MRFILKRRTEKGNPLNIDELDRFLHEEWKKVEMTIMSNLVHSMKYRCLAVIDSKGGRKNYNYRGFVVYYACKLYMKKNVFFIVINQRQCFCTQLYTG